MVPHPKRQGGEGSPFPPPPPPDVALACEAMLACEGMPAHGAMQTQIKRQSRGDSTGPSCEGMLVCEGMADREAMQKTSLFF